MLYKFGLTLDLPDLIFSVERLGGVMLNGHFGTNPYAIDEILKYLGIPYKAFNSVEKMDASLAPNNTYILSVWNDAGNVLSMVHTYMLEYVPKKGEKLESVESYELFPYNRSSKEEDKKKDFSSFSDIIHKDGCEFICGYLVKKPTD